MPAKDSLGGTPGLGAMAGQYRVEVASLLRP